MKAFGTTMEITTYPSGEYRSSPDLAQWVSKVEWHRVAIKWNLRLGQTGAWAWRQGDEVERISDKPIALAPPLSRSRLLQGGLLIESGEALHMCATCIPTKLLLSNL